jgi:Flp pilus assembly protein TadG
MRFRNSIDTRSETGQAAVEFALLAPVLVVLLLAILEMGITFNNYLAVTDAARAGARKAIVARISGLTNADVVSAVRTAASDLNQGKLSVSVDDPTDPGWTKPGSDISVTVTYPYSINVLGWVVSAGNLKSTMTDRLE